MDGGTSLYKYLQNKGNMINALKTSSTEISPKAKGT